MSRKNRRKTALVIILAVGCAVAWSTDIQVALRNCLHKQGLTIADNSDPKYDPGKEITVDPHGPDPHGPNPHGPDPYDEIHDPKLPANDPDSYVKSKVKDEISSKSSESWK